jgi:hypothetical protein
MEGFTKNLVFTDAVKDFEDKKKSMSFISRWFGIYELELTKKDDVSTTFH